MTTAEELDQIFKLIGDVCHERYMGCTKSRNTGNTNIDYDYAYTGEVVNMVDDPRIKAALHRLILKERREELQTLRGVVYGISGDGTVEEVLKHVDAVLASITTEIDRSSNVRSD